MAFPGLTEKLFRVILFCLIAAVLLIPLGRPARTKSVEKPQPSGITPIGVGLRPADVAVDPKTDRAVVANHESNNVSIIDLSTGKATTIEVGKAPEGVAIRPAQSPDDATRAIVSNSGEDTISIIDLDKQSVTNTIEVGAAPSGVAVHTGRNLAVVVNGGSDSVSVVDLSQGDVVDEIPVGKYPRGIAVNPTTNRVVVANRNSDTVSIIDLHSNQVIN